MFTLENLVNQGASLLMPFGPFMAPIMYTNPRHELLGCRESAWIGSFLSFGSPVYDIKGPDAIKLLNKVCVNRDFAKLKVGGSRHAILCNEKGQMLADGLLIRTGEDSFRTYWLAPVISYYVDSLGMDVSGEWIMDEYFFQIDGPRSLEIMEAASQTDLHDMKFAAKRKIKIAGKDVTIVRLGMSGALAYEIHGNVQEADAVYDAILQAGEKFDLRRLGLTQYCRNHTQGGYPNQWIHFYYPRLSSSEGLAEYIKTSPELEKFKIYNFLGSAADDVENAFVTPFDVEWDYLINYDHDFIGKEALEKLKANPPRKCVTLEWNAEDVGKVFAANFEGKADGITDDITTVGDGGEAPFVISKVMLDGTMVGVAAGRTIDFYHNRMISLAFIDRALAEEGKELEVIWGTPGTHQMPIRATVAQFPYYNEEYRNENFDVEKIPHPKFD